MPVFGFRQPFALQVEFLKAKLRLPTERWDDIWQEAHDRAFVVAGAAKADLLTDLHNAVIRAVEEGRGIEDFRKEFKQIVANNGWTGWTGQGTDAGEAWRTRVIYQTNMATSYAAGRYAQLSDPDLLSLRPYWKYHHLDGVLHPRPLHVSWGGMVLPHDHEFWKTHFPPNGWGCHCWVTAASNADYEKAVNAGKAEPPAGWRGINPKTGAPVGIDKGWAYAPGATTAGDLPRFIADKVAKLPQPIAAAFEADTIRVTQGARYWDPATAAGQWHEAALTSAPDSIKSLVSRIGEPEFVRSTQHATPRCSWRGGIEMGGMDKTSAVGQSAWRHEFGHLVDGRLTEGTKGPMYFSQTPDFVAALASDKASLIDAAAAGPASYTKTKAQRAALSAAYQEALTAIQAAEPLAWLEARYSAAGIDFNLAKTAIERQTVFSTMLEAPEVHKRYARIIVSLERRDAQGFMDALTGGNRTVAGSVETGKTVKNGMVGELSDLFGSVTTNKVSGYRKTGYGHSDRYYAKSPANPGAETFANLFCVHGQGDVFWVQALERLVPEVNRVFLGVLS